MNKITCILHIMLLFLLGNAAQANPTLSMPIPDAYPIHEKQDTVLTKTEKFKLYYPINEAKIDSNYLTNQTCLDRIQLYLKKSPEIDSIVIYSFSSPDGSFKVNKRLSDLRAAEAQKLILGLNPTGSDTLKYKLRLKPDAENWKGLEEAIRTHYPYADKEQVLAILEDEKLASDLKKTRLKKLPAKSWHFIRDSILPNLRYAEWVCTWKLIYSEIPVAHPQLTVGQPAFPEKLPYFEVAKVEPEPTEVKEPRTIVALKTNLLTTAASWLNYGIEVPFNIKDQKFSFAFDHQFPWWRWGENKNKFCMRYLQAGGELRWWFKPRTKPATKKQLVRDCLSGHYLGVYGMGGKYDFQNRRNICYQGEYWSTGLTYGYSLPISKRLNLEFFLSMGYASIPFRHFIPAEDFSELYRDPDDAGTWNYFGPTKVGISLVFPIEIQRTVKRGKGGLK